MLPGGNEMTEPISVVAVNNFLWTMGISSVHFSSVSFVFVGLFLFTYIYVVFLCIVTSVLL